MAGKKDQVKGQGKQAVGALTGDKDLESEGKADVRAGETKEKVDHGKRKIEEGVEKAEQKIERAIDSVKDARHRK